MPTVVVFFDERCLNHDTGRGLLELAHSPLLEVQELHPENSTRLRNMRSVLQRGPCASLLQWRTPHEATLDELSRVHDMSYLATILSASVDGRRFGSSTVLPHNGWLGVSLSAGAAIDAADAVLRGDSTTVSLSGEQPPTDQLCVRSETCFISAALCRHLR